MSIMTISKSVTLPPNWKGNDMALLKEYMSKVYSVNSSINDIFDDVNLEVIKMELTINIEVEDSNSTNEIVSEDLYSYIPVDNELVPDKEKNHLLTDIEDNLLLFQ